MGLHHPKPTTNFITPFNSLLQADDIYHLLRKVALIWSHHGTWINFFTSVFSSMRLAVYH